MRKLSMVRADTSELSMLIIIFINGFDSCSKMNSFLERCAFRGDVPVTLEYHPAGIEKNSTPHYKVRARLR